MDERPISDIAPSGSRPVWNDTVGETADGVGSSTHEHLGALEAYQAPDRYDLGRLLGSGARGRVYHARDRQLDRPVAIKFLAREHLKDGASLAAFIREARITARLEHSSILPLHELAFTERGEPYLTMRVAQGITLGEAISRIAGNDAPEQLRSLADRLAVFQRVCDAVAYAHAQGVIHRDLKPDNIMLGRFGEVLVLDWGSALTSDELGLQASTVIGSPAYMAPEQARGEAVDARCDVYALGATLFHLLFARHPLWIDDPGAFWQAKRSGSIQMPSESERAMVPTGLVEVVLRALAVDPRDRYADVPGLQEAIRGWQANVESLRLTSLGIDLVTKAQRTGGYAAYAEAAAAFRAALALWADNPEARAGLATSLATHARHALRQGDHVLATALARESGDRSLLSAARRQRSRGRWLRAVTVGALVLAVILLVLSLVR